MLTRTIEDRELVRRAAAGNVDAYNVLVSRWEKNLYNYLLRVTGNREDALDLAQDAFLKAYQGLATLGEAEKFPQWLFRIGHNLAMSKFRADGRRPQRDSETWEESSEGDPATTAGAPVLLGAGPRVFPLELELIVARAMEELTADQRQVVLLKVIHGFKFHEIAEILACPVSTVKSRIYAGFEQLKRALGEDVAAKAAFRGQ